MPAFAGFKDLGDYLEKRCKDRDLSFEALSTELKFNHSYIHGIATGRFEPSKKRADAIAAYFGDSPKTVRIIAGIELPPTGDDKFFTEIKESLAVLPDKGKQELIEYARYLLGKYPKSGSK